MQHEVSLASFHGNDFNKGAGGLKIILWYFVNALIVRASWNPFMGIKIALLKAFGAKIGRGLVIKNNVVIKSPWNLTVGDDCWIGENVWIDNLDRVTIGVIMFVFRRERCCLRVIMTIRCITCLTEMRLS